MGISKRKGGCACSVGTIHFRESGACQWHLSSAQCSLLLFALFLPPLTSYRVVAIRVQTSLTFPLSQGLKREKIEGHSKANALISHTGAPPLL